jgi:lysyl-tRNA synthetase, class I
VFGNEPPLNVPYEFLNIGGRKMSTSKGVGASAARMVEVVPPEQLRLLFLRPRPNTAIEFDPEGTDAIPRLFDESDRLAGATAGREVRGELPPHYDRVFTYSLVEPDADVAAEAQAYRPAFSHLALLEQIPGIDVGERVAAEKGSALTDREAAILDERRGAARAWLEAYAPDSARLAVQRDALPERIADADDAQRAYLGALGTALEDVDWAGESVQAVIFATATDRGLPAGRAFAALYLAFLGRPSGPRAGWLLAALDRSFVLDRLREAAAAGVGA